MGRRHAGVTPKKKADTPAGAGLAGVLLLRPDGVPGQTGPGPAPGRQKLYFSPSLALRPFTARAMYSGLLPRLFWPSASV